MSEESRIDRTEKFFRESPNLNHPQHEDSQFTISARHLIELGYSLEQVRNCFGDSNFCGSFKLDDSICLITNSVGCLLNTCPRRNTDLTSFIICTSRMRGAIK